MQHQYQVDSVGWGTPFLLCPEATTVDNKTLQQLCKAKEDDVVLSKNSPLGVRFNYLKGTSAEKEKLLRIENGKPGSPCTEKFLVSNTEFTKEPICTASNAYQSLKIKQLKTLDLTPDEYNRRYEDVTSKECLCIGLSNSAIQVYNLPPLKGLPAVTICPGPNIAYFNKIVTLQQMTDHIYGRTNVLDNQNRPHMFIKELELNVSYLKEQLVSLQQDNARQAKDILDFSKQLHAGIEYYRSLSSNIANGEEFENQLDFLQHEIESISMEVTVQKHA